HGGLCVGRRGLLRRHLDQDADGRKSRLGRPTHVLLRAGPHQRPWLAVGDRCPYRQGDRQGTVPTPERVRIAEHRRRPVVQRPSYRTFRSLRLRHAQGSVELRTRHADHGAADELQRQWRAVHRGGGRWRGRHARRAALSAGRGDRGVRLVERCSPDGAQATSAILLSRISLTLNPGYGAEQLIESPLPHRRRIAVVLPQELGRTGRTAMNGQRVTWAFILAAALLMAVGSAQAFDDSKYPNLKGQWERFVVRGLPGQPSHDQTKGWGELQGAPLTPEYQKIFEENVREQDAGGLGLGADHARCVAAGMPFMMVAFRPLEFIIT